MLSTRVNVMFNRRSWERLKTIAKKQSCTTSELVRRAVNDQYLSKTSLERIQAFEDILAIRPKPSTTRIDYKALINEGRKV